MINKFMKNKKFLLLSFGLLLVIIIVVLLLLFNKNHVDNIAEGNDGQKFKEEYESLNDKITEDGKTYPKVNISSDNIVKYASVNEILNMLNNHGDAVVYFGYPTCLYCRNAIQVLNNVAKNTELETIYYLDVEEKNDKYDELAQALGEELTTENNGKKEIYTPLVIFVANGKVVSYNIGTLFSQEDPYVKMDDSQIQGLSEIYEYGIRDVLVSINARKNAE